MRGYTADQRLTWTTEKPRRPGWYWMLDPTDPGLPTIVQIEHDWEHRRLVALVPASLYPRLPSAVIDPQDVNAFWAGPLAIPSVAGKTVRRLSSESPAGPVDMAA